MATAELARSEVRAEHSAVPGLVVTVLIASAATALGKLVPVVGVPVFGIVLGAFAAAVVPWLRD